jgi:formylglycine-generating enzyme required for sulfatase activity
MRNTCARRLLLAAASLWLAPDAPAVTFAWATVGDPGNACDDTPQQGCFGDVDYIYRIARHEVTNAQYAEFLNAKAAADPLALYNPDMASLPGGIARSGSSGSYTYAAIAGREQQPVSSVSYFDALRFANWLHNGQGDGDTETGAYTLLGGTPTPSNPLVQRNAGARVWLTTDDEWYKAAYYAPGSGTYHDYPTGTDTLITCAAPTATANTANCAGVAGGFTDVGSYPGSPSPNGTFDQGGNATEWTDGDVGILENRPLRGGGYHSPANQLRRHILEYDDPWFEQGLIGFRVARFPQCADGIDNDGDGRIDGLDPHCTSPGRDSEAPPRGCGLGVELSLVLPPLLWRRRRAQVRGASS